MGRKLKIKVFERNPDKYYTTNICKVAWLKMYNIYHEEIITNTDGKAVFVYTKTPRLIEVLKRLKGNEFMQKYFYCIKETIFDIEKFKKQQKEEDKQ